MRKLEMQPKLICAIVLVLIFSTLAFAERPTDPQPVQPNPVIVAKSGGHFTDPIAAMNSIIDASSTNPYLIKIMPGIYDLGAIPLRVKDYVSIEGSGTDVTKITGSVSDNGSSDFALVISASNSTVSNLTIDNKENTYSSVSLIFDGKQNATAKNVVLISNGYYGSTGVYVKNNADIKLIDSKIYAQNGLQMGYSTVTARDLYIQISIDTPGGSAESWQGVGLFNSHGDFVADGLTIDGIHETVKCTGIMYQSKYTVGEGVRGSFYLTNGLINVGNGNPQSLGVYVDANVNHPFELINSKVISSGTGVSATTGFGGTSFGNAVVANSYIEGSVNSIIGGTSVTRVVQSQLIGPLNISSSVKCLNNYDNNLLPISCQ